MKSAVALFLWIVGSAALAQSSASADTPGSDDHSAMNAAVQNLVDAVTTPEFQQFQCNALLREAEVQVARVLHSLDYTLVLTAQGKGRVVGNAECQLSVARTVTIANGEAAD